MNNYTALKNHLFFKGIDFDIISEIDPPGLNSIIEKMNSVRSMRQSEIELNKSMNDTNFTSKKIFENYSTGFSEKINIIPVISIIKEGIIKKKSPWFHYNTRKVVLYNTPKVEYIDPLSGVIKVNISSGN